MPNAYIMMHFRTDLSEERFPVFKGFSFSENPGWKHADDPGLLSGVLSILGYDGIEKGRAYFEEVLEQVQLYQLVNMYYSPEFEEQQMSAQDNAIDPPAGEQGLHRKAYLSINFKVDSEMRVLFEHAATYSSPGYLVTAVGGIIRATILANADVDCCGKAQEKLMRRIQANEQHLGWTTPWIEQGLEAHMARRDLIERRNRFRQSLS